MVMMNLFLVRHGEAVSESVDPERPLSEQGIEQVRSVAQKLKKSGVIVAAIYHSSKKRAQQTARIISEIINPQAALVQKEGLLPNDSIKTICEEIKLHSDDIMIVGHLPFLGILAEQLLDYPPDSGQISFSVASALWLTHSRGKWQVKNYFTPEQ
jgi:phosphohistidine phosphatase